MKNPEELVLGKPESDYRCAPGPLEPLLVVLARSLGVFFSFVVVAFGAVKLSRTLEWSPPVVQGLAAVVSMLLWAALLFGCSSFLAQRPRPYGRFAFGEQIEVTLIEGWHALLSWGEVLSYRERGPGVELHTTRPPPRPNKAGLLPDLPQTLWVPTRDEAERQGLLRLLRTKKIPRLR